jgi:hypothetical protein
MRKFVGENLSPADGQVVLACGSEAGLAHRRTRIRPTMFRAPSQTGSNRVKPVWGKDEWMDGAASGGIGCVDGWLGTTSLLRRHAGSERDAGRFFECECGCVSCVVQWAIRRPSSLVKLCQTLQFKKIFCGSSDGYPPKSNRKIFTNVTLDLMGGRANLKVGSLKADMPQAA